MSSHRDCLEIQRTIRDNATSLRDYVGDLSQWQDEAYAKHNTAPKLNREQKLARLLGKPLPATPYDYKNMSKNETKNINKKKENMANKYMNSKGDGVTDVGMSIDISHMTCERCDNRNTPPDKDTVRDDTSLPKYYEAWDKFDLDAELAKVDEDSDEEKKKK
eukprot:GHVR01132303.1.p1 GENE.GHVR01132303.1~~GHVR01132303.1.p1  ORF type:complete len:173 (+),score=44.88 GHVR01132303.1:36-521(+)